MDDALLAPESDGGAVRLAQWGVLRVTGADAAAFLHAQLTNDITGLTDGDARLAAWCSPKGRMLASFVCFRHGDDEIRLACRADVLPATLKRLRMFVLRAKAQLADGGEALVTLGLAGTGAVNWLAEQTSGSTASARVWSRHGVGGADVVRLPDGAGQARWLWVGPPEEAQAVLVALPALPLAVWQSLEVHSGIAPVVAATADAFVPQMLNYEVVGGVDFRKGCYPGQEVVARSQYRGTLKRRTALLHGDVPMQPGQDVFWSNDPGQPSGLVALGAAAPGGGHDALVELKLAALDSGSLHLGAPDGPALTVLPLPYPLPRETPAAEKV